MTWLVSAALLDGGAEFRWATWSLHWSTVIGLTALGALYFWRARHGNSGAGEGREGDSGPSPSAGQVAAFLTGLLLMFASLNGPLHDLSDTFLFSAHMVQHLVLTLIVPPLLLAGTPGWMLRPALDVPGVGAMARWVTRPPIAFAVFNVVLTGWHLPPLYNTALEHHSIHILEHLMFMAAAVIMWWPLMSRMPELPRLAYPGQMLYCFLMVIPMSVVAICIAMADDLLYPSYALASRVWGLSPMLDQQIGGLIMWIPGGLFFYGVMTVVFFKWSARGRDDEAGAQVNWRVGATPHGAG